MKAGLDERTDLRLTVAGGPQPGAALRGFGPGLAADLSFALAGAVQKEHRRARDEDGRVRSGDHPDHERKSESFEHAPFTVVEDEQAGDHEERGERGEECPGSGIA